MSLQNKGNFLAHLPEILAQVHLFKQNNKLQKIPTSSAAKTPLKIFPASGPNVWAFLGPVHPDLPSPLS